MSDNFNNCYRPLTSEEEWKSLLVNPLRSGKMVNLLKNSLDTGRVGNACPRISASIWQRTD